MGKLITLLKALGRAMPKRQYVAIGMAVLAGLIVLTVLIQIGTSVGWTGFGSQKCTTTTTKYATTPNEG